MAINDISLTSGMRSNLLSLQGTVSLLNRTQSRLASGKKVNTAIDNPVSYFASQSLNSRASKIDSLKDAMGQAISTITAADKGITAITTMIEQAKGIAQSAVSAASGTADAAVTLTMGASDISKGSAGTVGISITGSMTYGATITYDGVTLTATSGNSSGTYFKVVGTAATDASSLLAAINLNKTGTDGKVFTAVISGTVIVNISAVDSAADNVTITTSDFTLSSGSSMSTAVASAAVAGDTITIGGVTLQATFNKAVADASDTTFYVGTSTAATAVNLAAEININSTLTAAHYFAATESGSGKIGLQNIVNDIPTAITTAVVTVGTSGITKASSEMPSTELWSLQKQYNEMRTQITALAEDSGYKGKNLLSATSLFRTLDVKFEGNTLTVNGKDTTASGLGITAATWANTPLTSSATKIAADITKLDAALTTLSQESSSLSGNLSIITTRQDFSTNMVNTLTEGSDKLTLADTNEEGANMLMLQTRQSLATTALSLSAQAAQSVLKLFS